MAEINDKYGSVRQNLIDAGCDDQTTESCMACFNAGNMAKMLPALTMHRQTLLDELHKEQKRIDCLDYLVYTIQRDEKLKKGAVSP